MTVSSSTTGPGADRDAAGAPRTGDQQVTTRPEATAVAGPRTLAQLDDYFDALDYAWTDEDEAVVDGLVPPGHASTHGYHDPQYPFLGRGR